MLFLVLLLLAAIFFALDAFKVQASVAWTPLAFCALTVAALVYFGAFDSAHWNTWSSR